jgi:hypothetical protein
MCVIDKQKPPRAAFGEYEVRPVLLIRRSRGGLLKTGQGRGMTLTSHKLRLQSRHAAGSVAASHPDKATNVCLSLLFSV